MSTPILARLMTESYIASSPMPAGPSRMASTFVRTMRIRITIAVEPPIMEVDFSAST